MSRNEEEDPFQCLSPHCSRYCKKCTRIKKKEIEEFKRRIEECRKRVLPLTRWDIEKEENERYTVNKWD